MILLLLGLACQRPPPAPEALASPGPLTLGWRLIPGDSLGLRLETRLDEAGQSLTRVEAWDYLVTEVDPRGGARLRGRLTGLGVRLEREGRAVAGPDLDAARQAEKDRLSGAEVLLALGPDGRLEALSGVEGPDALPHRLLALPLPLTPVSVGDSWPDPGLVRPYAELMPLSLDLKVQARAQLDGLHLKDGGVQALVLSEGEVSPSGGEGPGLRLEGRAWWDLEAGLPVARELTVTFSGLDTGGSGALALSLQRDR